MLILPLNWLKKYDIDINEEVCGIIGLLLTLSFISETALAYISGFVVKI